LLVIKLNEVCENPGKHSTLLIQFLMDESDGNAILKVLSRTHRPWLNRNLAS
jgi:hypothetical protein